MQESRRARQSNNSLYGLGLNSQEPQRQRPSQQTTHDDDNFKRVVESQAKSYVRANDRKSEATRTNDRDVHKPSSSRRTSSRECKRRRRRAVCCRDDALRNTRSQRQLQAGAAGACAHPRRLRGYSCHRTRKPRGKTHQRVNRLGVKRHARYLGMLRRRRFLRTPFHSGAHTATASTTIRRR